MRPSQVRVTRSQESANDATTPVARAAPATDARFPPELAEPGPVGWQTILKQMPNHAPALNSVFHALADPSRRAIVDRLSRGPASVSELAQPLPMSLPAVVQHLQVLEASGLVTSEKIGRVRSCRIEPAALRPAERWISERRSGWERRLDRLGDYLAEQPDEPNGGSRP
jgi:DNA-binding transcriptional ArsR family regulator